MTEYENEQNGNRTDFAASRADVARRRNRNERRRHGDGRYTVRGDEFFLQGHFPDEPIVPGVILCEMAAQSSCLLMADEVKGKRTLYAGMNKVKFKNSVYPGDTVEFICEKIRSIGAFHFVRAEGIVNGKTAVSGEFSFALIDAEEIKDKKQENEKGENKYVSIIL